MNKYAAGMNGQLMAENFLQQKGYNIIARNYRVRGGEIDIIATYENYLIFIEVKTRSKIAYGLPREAVGAAKQNRIKNTAMHYIAENELADQDCRFDVVEVLTRSENAEIFHIENAF